MRPLFIGLSLIFFQQITGQPSVLYYAGKMFEHAGLKMGQQSAGIAGLLGAFKLLMTCEHPASMLGTCACLASLIASRWDGPVRHASDKLYCRALQAVLTLCRLVSLVWGWTAHAGVAVLTVDKGGRRPLLLIGVAGMVMSAALVGVAVLAAGNSMAVTYLSIVGLFIFVGSYQVGTPIP